MQVNTLKRKGGGDQAGRGVTAKPGRGLSWRLRSHRMCWGMNIVPETICPGKGSGFCPLVSAYHWLSPSQVTEGLPLAEVNSPESKAAVSHAPAPTGPGRRVQQPSKGIKTDTNSIYYSLPLEPLGFTTSHIEFTP